MRRIREFLSRGQVDQGQQAEGQENQGQPPRNETSAERLAWFRRDGVRNLRTVPDNPQGASSNRDDADSGNDADSENDADDRSPIDNAIDTMYNNSGIIQDFIVDIQELEEQGHIENDIKSHAQDLRDYVNRDQREKAKTALGHIVICVMYEDTSPEVRERTNEFLQQIGLQTS